MSDEDGQIVCDGLFMSIESNFFSLPKNKIFQKFCARSHNNKKNGDPNFENVKEKIQNSFKFFQV